MYEGVIQIFLYTVWISVLECISRKNTLNNICLLPSDVKTFTKYTLILILQAFNWICVLQVLKKYPARATIPLYLLEHTPHDLVSHPSHVEGHPLHVIRILQVKRVKYGSGGYMQRDVVYLGWPIAPSYIEPKCGGRWGVAGSQPMRTAVRKSPNKLCRSTYNLHI